MINPFIIEIEKWILITDNIVSNIEPWYYISNYGRIYSIKSNIILSQVYDKDGYYMVCLYLRNNTHINKSIHRLVMKTFKPILNSGKFQVNHKDGIKTNNYIWNLEWCTGKENIQHAYRIGLCTGRKGEENSGAIISTIQAEQIAQLLISENYTQKEIANIIGCTIHIVNSIANGYTWKYLYNKYKLYNISSSKIFTNEKLHFICKYFDEHKDDIYDSKNQLFREILNILDIEYTESIRKTMSRIYNRERYSNITSLYNY